MLQSWLHSQLDLGRRTSPLPLVTLEAFDYNSLGLCHPLREMEKMAAGVAVSKRSILVDRARKVFKAE